MAAAKWCKVIGMANGWWLLVTISGVGLEMFSSEPAAKQWAAKNGWCVIG